MRVDKALHSDTLLHFIKTLMQTANLIWISLGWASLISLLETQGVVLIEVEAFDSPCQHLHNLFPSVLLVSRSSRLWLKVGVIQTFIDFCYIVVMATWNPYHVIQVFFFADFRAEKDIQSSIVKDNDELVWIFSLAHRLKPLDVVNSSSLLDLSLIVVLDDSSTFEKFWVVAAHCASFCT